MFVQEMFPLRLDTFDGRDAAADAHKTRYDSALQGETDKMAHLGQLTDQMREIDLLAQHARSMSDEAQRLNTVKFGRRGTSTVSATTVPPSLNFLGHVQESATETLQQVTRSVSRIRDVFDATLQCITTDARDEPAPAASADLRARTLSAVAKGPPSSAAIFMPSDVRLFGVPPLDLDGEHRKATSARTHVASGRDSLPARTDARSGRAGGRSRKRRQPAKLTMALLGFSEEDVRKGLRSTQPPQHGVDQATVEGVAGDDAGDNSSDDGEEPGYCGHGGGGLHSSDEADDDDLAEWREQRRRANAENGEPRPDDTDDVFFADIGNFVDEDVYNSEMALLDS